MDKSAHDEVAKHEPFVCEEDRSVAFDVDDTLVHWVPTGQEPPPEARKIETWRKGQEVWVYPIPQHTALLKAHFQRGDRVIVWSQGGGDWANRVLKAFGLEEFVDIVVGKPKVYYDDIPASEWMDERRHVELKVGRIPSINEMLKEDD